MTTTRPRRQPALLRPLGTLARPRFRRGAATLAAVAVAAAAVAGAQLAPAAAPQDPLPAPPPSTPTADSATLAPQGGRASVPWGVGEQLNYEVKFGVLRVGNAAMEVRGTADVRGRETYHTVFRVRGGTVFYKVDDRFESWVDTRTLASRRFLQDQNEGRRERERRYEIFPERSAYQEGENAEQPSVEQPLDDGSFLYYVRTLPLRPGDVYEVDRYFKPDRNPVRIRVLRRERVTVPAGTFDAVVVQPTIKTKGIFGEGGRAEVWLSDDPERVMLQMKSQLKFGSLNLYLRSRQTGRKLAAR